MSRSLGDTITFDPRILNRKPIYSKCQKGKMPASDKPYLNFVIDPDLLKRLDDFRFRQRFATRAAAIKWLLDWALKQNPSPETS
jgi:hypothetical protein